MSYIGIQSGAGIGEDAMQFVRDNQDEIKQAGKYLYDNRAKVFQGISNAQRFVEKNLKGNPRPIRYLQEGEIHLPNHNYTGQLGLESVLKVSASLL
tara:strand:+ start:763 stop:1050 length:288 start_codon:yes stop_codon:yes gene_type:complete